jgi:hypothetical protein
MGRSSAPMGKPASKTLLEYALTLPCYAPQSRYSPPLPATPGRGVAGLPHYGRELKNPNFATVTQTIGLMGLRVENPADVRPALENAQAFNGPALVDYDR